MVNSLGESRSVLRVTWNGLKVTLPAPAPELWLPIFSTCSISKLKSSISKTLPCLMSVPSGQFGGSVDLHLQLAADQGSVRVGELHVGIESHLLLSFW